MKFNLEEIIRPNIRKMSPYSSARDEYDGEDAVLLDANENPFNPPYNRYPDPRQRMLKEKIGAQLGVSAGNIFLGNGSDEAIDLLIRISCEPGNSRIVAIEPSYGMYQVAAETNDVELVKVLLNKDFSLNPDAILEKCDPRTRLIFLCSPNNPTSNLLETPAILKIAENFMGLLVVDEAYIEFSGSEGLIRELADYPNLVLLRTLSKSWGLAGIRLGMALGSASIISYLGRIKYPYNLNSLTQDYAMKAFNNTREKDSFIQEILKQRDLLRSSLSGLSYVEKIYPSDANFLLVKVKGARELYNYLKDRYYIVRDRSSMPLCEGCLRITIGTREENEGLVNLLQKYTGS